MLEAHHSASTLPRELRALSGTQGAMTTPWKCRSCRTTCRAAAEYCSHCRGTWTEVEAQPRSRRTAWQGPKMGSRIAATAATVSETARQRTVGQEVGKGERVSERWPGQRQGQTVSRSWWRGPPSTQVAVPWEEVERDSARAAAPDLQQKVGVFTRDRVHIQGKRLHRLVTEQTQTHMGATCSC